MNFQRSCDSVDETKMRKISEKNSRTWKALRNWERRCLSMLTITFPADVVGFGFGLLWDYDGDHDLFHAGKKLKL